MIGAIGAVLVYKLIKSLEYETANPVPEDTMPETSGHV